MHIVKSDRLARIFDELGIGDELLAFHRYHEADHIVKKMYGSHDIARRVHYLLKQLDWFNYLCNYYYYRLYEDPLTNNWYLGIYVRQGNKLEEIWRIPESVDEERLYIQRRAGAIVVKEHVKEENEETYFNRSKGLF